MVVECTLDEAVGIAIAQGMPVGVERDLWESASVSKSNVAHPRFDRKS